MLRVKTLNFMRIKSNQKIRKKNNFIHEKNYKDLVIFYNRYGRGKSIIVLSLWYHKLIGKIEVQEGKKFWMIDDYVLHKELDRIK